MPERIAMDCPFCKQKVIQVMYEPSHLEFVYSHAAGKSVKKAFNKPEKYEILSDKCPNCGKSKKDIENSLKYGKEPSNEEVIRRLREAGLNINKLR